jgi:CheY-like chemotaxis protein
VLVVDDTEDVREVVITILEAHGFVVASATHGREALERLRGGFAPCLILLDLMMPVMDGWEFRRAQMDEPALATLPTIVMSGMHDVRHEARRLGVRDILPKPIEVDRLLALAERYSAAAQ